MGSYRLPVGDRPYAADSAGLLRQRLPADRVEVLLVHPDGTRDAVALPEAAVAMITDLLERAASGEELAVLAEDGEISPEDAASVLGISRPLVRRRMDAGELPFRRVGTHRRLRLRDVLALRDRESPVRAALAELQTDTDNLMAHGL
jgi:excisionase family DNA binding protein